MKRKNLNSHTKKRHIPPTKPSSTPSKNHLVESVNLENITPNTMNEVASKITNKFDCAASSTKSSTMPSHMKAQTTFQHHHHRMSGIPIAIGASPMATGGGATTTSFSSPSMATNGSRKNVVVNQFVSHSTGQFVIPPKPLESWEDFASDTNLNAEEATKRTDAADDDEMFFILDESNNEIIEDANHGDEEDNCSADVAIHDSSSSSSVAQCSRETTAILKADDEGDFSLSYNNEENGSSDPHPILEVNNMGVGPPISITELAIDVVIPRLEDRLQSINSSTDLYMATLRNNIKNRLIRSSSKSAEIHPKQSTAADGQNIFSVLFFAILSFFLGIFVKMVKSLLKNK